MGNLTFSIKGASESPARFAGRARHFKILVDEPEGLGGTDQGANPVEFLLAAYAGCLNVVGHLIAKELGFTLHKIDIHVEGDINPDRLFGTSDAERAGFSGIKVSLTPHADTDAVTLKKWLEIVETRCPVNDNLANPTPVSIQLNKFVSQVN